MKKTTKLLTLLIFLLHLNLHAQQKYWIFFKDKDLNQSASLSEITIKNRRMMGLSECQYTDIPVNQKYISSLKSIDIQVIRASKWLNAVSAELSKSQIEALKNLEFVTDFQPINSQLVVSKINKNDDLKVDFVMNQIGIESFLQAGLSAKNVIIGVIDAGFYEAHENTFLKHLFKKGKILGTKDLVNPTKTDFFGISETSSDFHGTEVLSAIAGKNEDENTQTGLATNASFYLARTDNGNREFRGEEDNWIAAMEWMDSLGVRLINTSLGYAKGFSNPKENYKPEQMNGRTSVISKAAQIAIEQKGIILVVSAGNEGDDKDWRIISTPADVEATIAVGATNEKGLKMGYSSIGPEFICYTKPNVSCFSLFGTSLSAPVITGFVGCMLEANQYLTPKEAKEILEKSSNLYPFANNYIGFGIPRADKALSFLNNQEVIRNNRKIEVEANEKQLEILAGQNSQVILFRKKNATQVLSQESFTSKYNFISLKKLPNEKQTTVVLENELIEVFWK